MDKLDESALQEIHSFIPEGTNKLKMIHGSVIKIGDSIIVLSGPRGIGKSTLCKQLTKQGAKLVDDGALIIVETKGKQLIIPSNMASYNRAYNFYKEILRKPFRKIYQHGDPQLPALTRIDTQIAKISAFLGALTARRSSTKTLSLPITRILFFNDHLEQLQPKLVDTYTAHMQTISPKDFKNAHFIRSSTPRFICYADIANFLI